MPEGKLARVGDVLLGPRDVASVSSQLGEYAQLRFAGDEGQRTLVESLIVTELLAQEAAQGGLQNDPRVEHAVLEEIATVYLSSELERAVPYASVAGDEAALRAYYDAHPEEFTKPERRSMRGVRFPTMAAAEEALERLRRGEVTLEGLGPQIGTPVQARNDAEFPMFHPFLFAEGLGKRDWLPHPVILAQTIVAGQVLEVKPATLEPFDSPKVQERLVRAVRQPKLDAARKALLARLREQHPDR